jgi:hypothetical protein
VYVCVYVALTVTAPNASQVHPSLYLKYVAVCECVNVCVCVCVCMCGLCVLSIRMHVESKIDDTNQTKTHTHAHAHTNTHLPMASDRTRQMRLMPISTTIKGLVLPLLNSEICMHRKWSADHIRHK